VAKANLLFEFVVVALNTQAQFGGVDKLTERNVEKQYLVGSFSSSDETGLSWREGKARQGYSVAKCDQADAGLYRRSCETNWPAPRHDCPRDQRGRRLLGRYRMRNGDHLKRQEGFSFASAAVAPRIKCDRYEVRPLPLGEIGERGSFAGWFLGNILARIIKNDRKSSTARILQSCFVGLSGSPPFCFLRPLVEVEAPQLLNSRKGRFPHSGANLVARAGRVVDQGRASAYPY
jgi:hypothetical protein